MAGKKNTEGSSSKPTAGRRNSGNMQRDNLNNGNRQTEADRREEIFYLLSRNLITREFARAAWLESIERDLRQVRMTLQALERATRGGSKCGSGKNPHKRKAKGL